MQTAEILVSLVDVRSRCISSVEREKGLTTSHLNTQLDPFASKLTIYSNTSMLWQKAHGKGIAPILQGHCLQMEVVVNEYALV